MRFAVDTGGTFTDLVVEDDSGGARMYKSETTPSDPVAGVLDTLELAAADYGLSRPELLAKGDMLILVGLGLVASLQQIALSASHRFAPASMLASLRYLSIPVGMGAGVMFFDELITAQFVGGSAIVIVASIFIVYRERVIGSP